MFLLEDDYKAQLKEQALDALTGYNNHVRMDVEIKAQAEMESYLRERYDAAAIFSAVGNDRNPLIKMFMVDIAVYHLFCAIAPRNIPQIRLDRYNSAIKWLDMVRKGQISPALPALQATNSTTNNSIFGSNTAQGYNW
jgi:phage gp36-like protein